MEASVKHKKKLTTKQLEQRNAYLFLSPYILLFCIFIIIPIVIAILLSFTTFDSVNFPVFSFKTIFNNYIYLFTRDSVFMQYVLPNTIKYAIILVKNALFQQIAQTKMKETYYVLRSLQYSFC